MKNEFDEFLMIGRKKIVKIHDKGTHAWNLKTQMSTDHISTIINVVNFLLNQDPL